MIKESEIHYLRLQYISFFFKVIVHLEIKTISLIQPHVDPNPDAVIHKGKKCSCRGTQECQNMKIHQK